MDKILELEDKEKLDPQHGFVIQHYDEKSDAPPFLAEYDYYFEKTALVDIREEELEEISDSEQQARQTSEELERKQKDQLNDSLKVLLVSDSINF